MEIGIAFASTHVRRHPGKGPAFASTEIVRALTIAVDTVRTHMRALFELFEFADMPQNR